MKISRIAMVLAVALAAIGTWGCATASGPVSDSAVRTDAGQDPAEGVLAALEGFLTALKAGDTEIVIAAFSDDYGDSRGGDISSVRPAVEDLIAQGVFTHTSVNMSRCDITVTGDRAVAGPVIYESATGSSAHEYRMKNDADGVWRIVGSEEILLPVVDVWTAAATGNVSALTRHVPFGTDLNALDPIGGSTPLNMAAMLGQTSAAGYLTENGADVNAKNRDGNSALHIAAFFGHTDLVALLLKKGADTTARGSGGQTPLESVAEPWTEQLEGIYQAVEGALQMQLDYDQIKAARPKIAALLRGQAPDLDSEPVSVKDLPTIKLPPPQMSGGRPLMDVLKDRKTTRSFSKTKLPDQVLSNLLWAAWGINRPEKGLHTAPSSSNQQEIDVYVALEKGLYVYEPKAHELKLVLAEDLRGATGTQRFVKNVPLNLVYVADHGRMYPGSGMDENMKFAISSANTGFIAQNVYLFCASEGLGTVVRGLVDREALAKRMKLRPGQMVVYAQSIGYPKGSM